MRAVDQATHVTEIAAEFLVVIETYAAERPVANGMEPERRRMFLGTGFLAG